MKERGIIRGKIGREGKLTEGRNTESRPNMHNLLNVDHDDNEEEEEEQTEKKEEGVLYNV